MTILALESSCDDTCAAVLGADGRLRANVISSQGVHDRFGGVVPEIASRQHLELINLVVEQALGEAGVTLEQIDLVAATQGPGLVGALLVGFSTGKALAAARALPFAPVDHLQGHVAANFLALTPGDGSGASEPGGAFEPPFLCLIASGGHTLLVEVTEHEGYEVLGRTLDDAAGEAFDKGARMLGLGYPGGAALEGLAAAGDPEAFSFPGSRAERARGGRGHGPGSVCAGPRLLLRRAEDGAALQAARARRGRGPGAPRRPRGLLSGGDRRQPDPARRACAGADRHRPSGGGGRRGRQRRSCAGGWASSTRSCTSRRACSAPTTPR